MKEYGYSQDFIERLKSKNDIVSIIGQFVHLDKKGKNHWACCPFHHEKTPSFCINEYDQFYHCFGCGESGDVITFLRKYENMDYGEAIRWLADRAGMELPHIENNEKYREKKKLKDKYLEILNLTKDIYKRNIYDPKAKLAQEYIKKRKLTRKELENFELGYSFEGFQIVNILRAKNFTDEDLKASGVCEISKSGKPYDFLSERLVFPIVNAMGDCIGFSGRDLSNLGYMKYKNTASTIVFDKSKAVYAINLLKKAKQEQELENIIIVEGQFDVITMHRYGFTNTVACMGTAITKEHLRELKRFSDNVILCLDGDSAGLKASLRTLDVFDGTDLKLKVAVLPSGADPDEFLSANGADAMKKILNSAITPMDFKIFMIKSKFDITTREGKSAFVKEILKEISKIESSSEREIYLTEIKEITGISTDILRRDLTDSEAKPKQEEPAKPFLPTNEQDATVKAQKFIVASILHNKDYVNLPIKIEEYIKVPSLKEVLKLINEKKSRGERFIISTLFDIFDMENEPIVQSLVNFNFEKIDDLSTYFENCVWQVVESDLKFRKLQLSKQYKEEIDIENKKSLLKQIANIDLQLKNKKLGENF